MFLTSIQTIEQFKEVLIQLPKRSYTQPCDILSNATIGQHTRHVIELYQCLLANYGIAKICYDKRERNTQIEEDVTYAVAQLTQIQQALEKPDKELIISYDLGENEVFLQSNFLRELMYNLEHMIHHQALIRVGVNRLTDVTLPDSFGVAPSTIQFRKQCVQ